MGLAVGTGTDIAIEAADVVLMSGRLTARVGCHRAFQGRRCATSGRTCSGPSSTTPLLIPVAAGALWPAFGILLSPIFAAGAMALSSVFVLGNALRLRRFAPSIAV